MTARSKLRGPKKEAASSCPFARVESFLVAKVSIGERRCCGDVDRVVRRPILAALGEQGICVAAVGQATWPW